MNRPSQKDAGASYYPYLVHCSIQELPGELNPKSRPYLRFSEAEPETEALLEKSSQEKKEGSGWGWAQGSVQDVVSARDLPG